MVAHQQLTVTRADRDRLRGMISSLRDSLPISGEPYGSYLNALERHLDRASSVTPSAVDGDTVTMNSRVCLQDLDTGDRQIVTLAYDADADPLGEEVSVLTTLGASLLGSRVGDVIEWDTRRGRRRMRVERILFQPEAAGKFDL
jgi:regulator of nucleoside diphosphate kinase